MGTGKLAGFAYIVLIAASLAAGAPILYDLPVTPGVSGFQLTADGSVAVGTVGSNPVVWTAAQGVHVLANVNPSSPFLPTGAATAASADGIYIAGYQNVSVGSSTVNQPVRWGPGGTINLGDLDTSGFADNKFGRAHGVSANGSIVVGETGSPTNRQAFRWTALGGMLGLGKLPGDSLSRASDVSGDGAVVVGSSVLEGAPLNDHGFRWTAATGLIAIPDLPGGLDISTPNAITPDGNIIVGAGSSTASSGGSTGLKAEAYRWTAATGTAPLGDLPGGDYYSIALDVTANGNTVVGYSFVDGSTRAFIWDQAHGMRSLQDVLEMEYGVNLGGRTLFRADSISDDGNVISGTGRLADGTNQSWIINLIPEPTGLALVAAGGLLLQRRRRKGETNLYASRTYL